MTYMEIAADSFFGCSRRELIILPFKLSMMKHFVSFVKMRITPAESSGFAAFWFFGLVITTLFWGLTWNAIDMMGEWTLDRESVRNIIDNELISTIATWNKDKESQIINSLFRVLTSTSLVAARTKQMDKKYLNSFKSNSKPLSRICKFKGSNGWLWEDEGCNTMISFPKLHCVNYRPGKPKLLTRRYRTK